MIFDDQSEWLPYTKEELRKVATSKNERRWGAFRVGLEELRAALEGEHGDVEIQKEKKIKTKPLGLKKQQMTNERLFIETMLKIANKIPASWQHSG